MNTSNNITARAALYAERGSTLMACAHQACRIGLRVVTMIQEDCPGVGFPGPRLTGLVDRLGEGEFEVIVAEAGSGRLVTISAVPAHDDFTDDGKGVFGADESVVDPTLRCAIYNRSATAEGSGSLAAQMEGCHAYAVERGWRTVAVYKDVAVSGMTSSRPSLDAMIAAAEHDVFDVVLVEDLTRLSRNVLHVHRLLNDLEAQGIAVHAVNCAGVADREAAVRSAPIEPIQSVRSVGAQHGSFQAARRKPKA